MTDNIIGLVILMIFAALFLGVGWWSPVGTRWDPLIWALRLIGLGFALILIYAILTAGLDRFAAALRNFNAARVAHQTAVADALRGLSQAQGDYVMRVGELAGWGIPSPDGPVWYMRFPDGVDVPQLFIVDYLRWSAQTYPQLWPIREAGVVGGDNTWKGARRFAETLTRHLVGEGYAKVAAGTNAATLTVDLEVIAGLYGIDFEEEIA
jgi:hypothetical protein